MPGNHENWDLIEQLPQEKHYGAPMYRYDGDSGNIWFMKRGAFYDINGTRIFTYGGATSVDKDLRVPGVSWWEHENPSVEELKDIDKIISIIREYGVDYILTHTAPREVCRIVLNSVFGGTLTPCITADVLQKIYENIDDNFIHWYFGHWHADWRGGKFTCLYNEQPIPIEG